MATRKCEHVKRDGVRCKASVMKESDFCFFHDPATVQKRTAARRAGGVARAKGATTLPPETTDLALGSVADVVSLLAETINQVRKGVLDQRTANSVGYLGSILLRALEQSDTEKRLAALEAVIATQPASADLYDEKESDLTILQEVMP